MGLSRELIGYSIIHIFHLVAQSIAESVHELGKGYHRERSGFFDQKRKVHPMLSRKTTKDELQLV